MVKIPVIDSKTNAIKELKGFYLFIYLLLPEITMRQSHANKHEAGQGD